MLSEIKDMVVDDRSGDRAVAMVSEYDIGLAQLLDESDFYADGYSEAGRHNHDKTITSHRLVYYADNAPRQSHFSIAPFVAAPFMFVPYLNLIFMAAIGYIYLSAHKYAILEWLALRSSRHKWSSAIFPDVADLVDILLIDIPGPWLSFLLPVFMGLPTAQISTSYDSRFTKPVLERTRYLMDIIRSEPRFANNGFTIDDIVDHIKGLGVLEAGPIDNLIQTGPFAGILPNGVKLQLYVSFKLACLQDSLCVAAIRKDCTKIFCLPEVYERVNGQMEEESARAVTKKPDRRSTGGRVRRERPRKVSAVRQAAPNDKEIDNDDDDLLESDHIPGELLTFSRQLEHLQESILNTRGLTIEKARGMIVAAAPGFVGTRDPSNIFTSRIVPLVEEEVRGNPEEEYRTPGIFVMRLLIILNEAMHNRYHQDFLEEKYEQLVRERDEDRAAWERSAEENDAAVEDFFHRGQMGKHACAVKDTLEFSEGGSSGRVEVVDPRKKSLGLGTLEMWRAERNAYEVAVSDMANIDYRQSVHRQVAMAVLKHFKKSPPSVYVFDDIIRDLFGFNSREHNMVALQYGICENPVAIWHELAEMLMDKSLKGVADLTLKYIPSASRRDKPSIEVSMGSFSVLVEISGRTAMFIRRERRTSAWPANWRGNQHYLLRILQHEIFDDKDRGLTRSIQTIRHVHTTYRKLRREYGGKAAWLEILRKLGIVEEFGMEIPVFPLLDRPLVIRLAEAGRVVMGAPGAERGIYDAVRSEVNPDDLARLNMPAAIEPMKFFDKCVASFAEGTDGIDREYMLSLLKNVYKGFLMYGSLAVWDGILKDVERDYYIQICRSRSGKIFPQSARLAIETIAARTATDAIINQLIVRQLAPADRQKYFKAIRTFGPHMIWRSSGEGEDGRKTSMAGKASSPAVETLASLTPLYIDDENLKGSLCRFPMDRRFPETSGVIFSNLGGKIAIEMGIGEGSSVVDAKNNTIIDIDRNTGIIEDINYGFWKEPITVTWRGITISDKEYIRQLWAERTMEMKSSSNGQRRRVPVMASPSDQARLINNLRLMVLKAEKCFGFPVDVEWICERGRIKIVQIRPQTGNYHATKLAEYEEEVMAKIPASVGSTDGFEGRIVWIDAHNVPSNAAMRNAVAKLRDEYGHSPANTILASYVGTGSNQSDVDIFSGFPYLIDSESASRNSHPYVNFREAIERGEIKVIAGIPGLMEGAVPGLEWEELKVEADDGSGRMVSVPVRASKQAVTLVTNNFKGMLVRTGSRSTEHQPLQEWLIPAIAYRLSAQYPGPEADQNKYEFADAGGEEGLSAGVDAASLPSLFLRMANLIPLVGRRIAYWFVYSHEGLHRWIDRLTGGGDGRIIIDKDDSGNITGGRYTASQESLMEFGGFRHTGLVTFLSPAIRAGPFIILAIIFYARLMMNGFDLDAVCLISALGLLTSLFALFEAPNLDPLNPESDLRNSLNALMAWVLGEPFHLNSANTLPVPKITYNDSIRVKETIAQPDPAQEMRELFVPAADTVGRGLESYSSFIKYYPKGLFETYMKRARVYADFGCGLGLAPLQAAMDNRQLIAYGIDLVDWNEHLGGSEWTGFDWNGFRTIRRMLEMAGRYRFFNEDIERAKLPRKADIATCFFALQYKPDPLAAIKNMFDQVAVGGALFAELTVPTGSNVVEYCEAATRAIPGAHINRISRIKNLEGAGYIDVCVLYLPRSTEKDTVNLNGLSLASSNKVKVRTLGRKFTIHSPRYEIAERHHLGPARADMPLEHGESGALIARVKRMCGFVGLAEPDNTAISAFMSYAVSVLKISPADYMRRLETYYERTKGKLVVRWSLAAAFAQRFGFNQSEASGEGGRDTDEEPAAGTMIAPADDKEYRPNTEERLRNAHVNSAARNASAMAEHASRLNNMGAAESATAPNARRIFANARRYFSHGRIEEALFTLMPYLGTQEGMRELESATGALAMGRWEHDVESIPSYQYCKRLPALMKFIRALSGEQVRLISSNARVNIEHAIENNGTVDDMREFFNVFDPANAERLTRESPLIAGAQAIARLSSAMNGMALEWDTASPRFGKVRAEVLTDTSGVEFNPYLLQTTRTALRAVVFPEEEYRSRVLPEWKKRDDLSMGRMHADDSLGHLVLMGTTVDGRPAVVITLVQPSGPLWRMTSGNDRDYLNLWKRSIVEWIGRWGEANGVSVYAAASEAAHILFPALGEAALRSNYEKPFENDCWKKETRDIPLRLPGLEGTFSWHAWVPQAVAKEVAAAPAITKRYDISRVSILRYPDRVAVREVSGSMSGDILCVVQTAVNIRGTNVAAAVFRDRCILFGHITGNAFIPALDGEVSKLYPDLEACIRRDPWVGALFREVVKVAMAKGAIPEGGALVRVSAAEPAAAATSIGVSGDTTTFVPAPAGKTEPDEIDRSAGLDGRVRHFATDGSKSGKAARKEPSLGAYSFEVNLEELARSAVKNISEDIPDIDKKITYEGLDRSLTILAVSETRTYILCQPKEYYFRRFFEELIKNAYEANPQGNIVIRLVEQKAGAGNFILEIQNDGEIEQEVLERLYSKLNRGISRYEVWLDKQAGELVVEQELNGNYIRSQCPERFVRDGDEMKKVLAGLVNREGLAGLPFIQGLSSKPDEKVDEEAGYGFGLWETRKRIREVFQGDINIDTSQPGYTTVKLSFHAREAVTPAPAVVTADEPSAQVEEILTAIERLTDGALAAKPIPAKSAILLSETLFDQVDRQHLKELLGENSPVRVVPARDMMHAANNGHTTKNNLVCVMRSEDYDDPEVWNDRQKRDNKATLVILGEDLTGSRYIYLKGVVGWARALMNDETDRARAYLGILFNKTRDMDDAALLRCINEDPREFANCVRFRPITPFDGEELPQKYKLRTETNINA